MKRDVDLIRHLLFDIERHGAECSIDILRNGAASEIDQRTQYHVRLLIDAGLVKEIDRAAAGALVVRLTSAGHELLELCRSDLRWREAKWVVEGQTGGLSLSVLRAVLTKWAVDSITRSERHRRWRRAYRPYPYRDVYHGEPVYRVDSYRYDREPPVDEELVRFARARAVYGERADLGDEFDGRATGHYDPALAEDSLGVSLPVHMI